MPYSIGRSGRLKLSSLASAMKLSGLELGQVDTTRKFKVFRDSVEYCGTRMGGNKFQNIILQIRLYFVDEEFQFIR